MKLLCRSVFVHYKNMKYCTFKKGEWYDIVYESDVSIGLEWKAKYFWAVIHFCKQKTSPTFEYVWDYFYTTQEIRKLKLEKLRKSDI